jgi:hypothetical protein
MVNIECIDALIVPFHKFAIVATTGHHVRDPKYSGVVALF